MKIDIVNYVVERLREFSTWRGIGALAATAGVITSLRRRNWMPSTRRSSRCLDWLR